MAPLVENSSDVTAAPRYRSAIGPRSSSTSTRIRGRSMLALAAAAVGNQLPAISAFIPTAPSPSCPASAASTTAALVRSNRERERRELVELNDRFANYVERVRFLEAQNKKLKLEVDGLRRQIDGANGHSRLKEMYETELNEARALVDQTARQKNEVELRSRKLEDEASDLRDQLESLHLVRSGERKTLEGLSRQIADNEAELGLVHRRLKDTDEEYKRQRSETQKLSAQIQATMSELYQETALKLELQNEKQSLEEEISFLRQIHAQELEEILANNAAASSEVIDPSLFFKHELANAIRDIRSEYEALNQQQRQEIENWYRLKVAEIVNESRRPAESSIGRLRDEEELRQLREQVTVSKKDAGNLRIRNRDLQTRIQELEQVVDQERRQGDRERELRDRELDELRSRFEQVLAEYDELVSSKTTLDSEIAIYRKLLEGEEHRNQEPPFESVVEPSAAAEPRPPAASSSSSSEVVEDVRPERRVHFDSNLVQQQQHEDDPISSTEALAAVLTDLDQISTNQQQQLLINVSIDQSASKLALVVRQARDLVIPTRPGNLSGLYVRCVVPANRSASVIRQKSHSVTPAKSPVWNTLFEFDYDKDVVVANVQLSVKGTCSGRVGRVFTLGSVKLDRDQLMAEPIGQDRWINLYRGSSPINSTSSSSSSSDSTDDASK